MRKQPLKTVVRFIMHRMISGEIRQTIYTVPYYFFIGRFMKKVNINDIPLFSYIEIETINRCNGLCSFCPVNANQKQRPYAKMTDFLFKKIIDELSGLKYSGELHLFSNNEPLLDDRIVEFSQYAKEKVPSSYLTLYTNGSLLDIEKTIELTKYLDLLVIDNYSENGELPNNIREIREFCKEKDLLNKVVIDNKKPMSILSSRGGQAPNKRKASLWGVGKGCIYPFRQMVVRPDGKCSLCCNDALGKYTLGDVQKDSLMHIWYSKEYRSVRETMISCGRKGLALCNKCDTHYFDGT
ncbi:radical SAM/SPASM domain-containing protein [Butyrivibrio sp. XPD2002]|uniref:radical SAM/SPASM domain-containing protein n=1 Tax=Butyrivibrio sp. XPD2002 TaxID=1280665 RepID=UPI000409C2EE|nr:radical SAM/SPASM domain-containing protein [Butyrivibrio sp. XPD2002]